MSLSKIGLTLTLALFSVFVLFVIWRYFPLRNSSTRNAVQTAFLGKYHTHRAWTLQKMDSAKVFGKAVGS